MSEIPNPPVGDFSHMEFTRLEIVVPSDKRDYMLTIVQRLSNADEWQIAMLGAIAQAETVTVSVPYSPHGLFAEDRESFTAHTVRYLRGRLMSEAEREGKSVVAWSEPHFTDSAATMQARVVPVGEVPWVRSR